ncbi:hypothetical protein P691DRAFT_129505 [Macrolepiota fuliginosa MF-IS2]|uniref:Uncharacterized protein n=1 Tax=Macrolepiota fuliginosa MF-IS2 TaxID=1400762 RepID=A0A9P5XA47_9AGAR|nr:hypothetical protein P691DRAFT_129505 [Macrolepiota fuliginosa MF-IS2]
MHIAQSESTRNTPRPRGIRQDNAKRPPNPCSSIAASGLFLLPFDMPVPPPLPLPDFWIGRGAPCEFGCRCGAKPTGAGIGAGLGVTLQYQDDSFRGTPGRLNRGSDSGRARCCSRTGVRRRLQKEKVAKFHKRRLVAKGRKGVHGVGHIRRVKRKGMRRRLRGRRVNHRAKKGKIVPVQDIAIVPTSSVGPLAALSLSPTLTPSPLSSTSFEEGPEARNAFCDYDDYSCFPSPIPGEGVPTKSLFDEMRECMEMQGVDVPEAFLEFVEYKELEGGGCDVGMNGGGETKRIELTAELEVQGGQILGTACVGSNGAVDTGEERVNLVSPGAKKRVDTDDNWTSGSDLFSMLSVDCDRPLSTDLSKNALDTPVSLRFLASLAFLTGSRGEETERKIPEAVGEEECTSGTATNCGGTGLRARIPHTKHTMRVVAVVEEGQAQKEDVYVVKSDVRKAEQGAKRVPDEVAVAAEEGIPEMNTTKKGDILKGWSANAVAEGVALASQGGNGDSRREVREESRCLTLIKFTPLSDSAALEQCRGPLSSAKPRTKMMMDVMWSHSSSHR